MTYKEMTRKRFPNATAEEYAGYPATTWCVWDIPSHMVKLIQSLGDISRGRVLLGCGTTEEQAWRQASYQAYRSTNHD